MKKAPIPENEKERLVSLYKLRLLDTKPEERFDRITSAATKIFHVPISTLTLVDEKREWFKSVCGLDQEEGDRAISFCGHALLTDEILVIPDTTKDKRFFNNPMVVGKPYIRFYAGVPITSADGQRVGVFCVKDVQPRTFVKDDEDILKGLATWAEIEINSRNLSLALAARRKLQKGLSEQKKAGDKMLRVMEDLKNSKIAARNIYEDLQAEKEKLAEAKAKDEAMLASIGDGVIIVDPAGKITFMNQSARGLFGLEEPEVVGKLLFDIIPIEDEGGQPVPMLARPMAMALAIGSNVATTKEEREHTISESKTAHRMFYYLHKDKTKFPASVNVSPVRLGQKIIGAIEIFHDITKEKEIDRAKTEFISIASHQLRTPVSGLSWLIEALQFTSQSLDPKQKTYIRDLAILSKRLIGLVEDLLNLSRIQMKTPLVTEKSRVDILTFMDEFVKEIGLYAGSKKHTIIFNKLINEPVILEINRKSLYNVLQNLVSNAIEYSPENTAITINVEKVGPCFTENSDLATPNGSVGANEAGDFIKTSVSNKGPSIPKDEQAQLFGRFYRGESAKKMKPEGTGLGLYIIKMITEEMGGKVGFKSEEGKDTMFWFTLPLAKR